MITSTTVQSGTPNDGATSGSDNNGDKSRSVLGSKYVAYASLIASILWLWCIGSVLGIVLGTLYLRRAEVATHRRLAVAAIAIGIVGILATIASIALLNSATSASTG